METKLESTTIGLISDTHYGERLFNIPNKLLDIWSNIDLILHAGDIGEISLLDQLRKIAPIIAVHGNDEPNINKEKLPNQQILSYYSHKLLLWHSHYPDPMEEKAKRAGIWRPKLDRISDYGKEVGADIVIYGHTHIPMISQIGPILLINPGALASGSFFTRQMICTVGILKIFSDNHIDIQHYDLITGKPINFPAVKPSENYSDYADRFQGWIIEPELIPVAKALMSINYIDIRLIIRNIHPVYRKAMMNGHLRKKDLLDAFRSAKIINPIDKEKVMAILEKEHLS
jgi:putative phosphoesterase